MKKLSGKATDNQSAFMNLRRNLSLGDFCKGGKEKGIDFSTYVVIRDTKRFAYLLDSKIPNTSKQIFCSNMPQSTTSFVKVQLE